MKIFLIGVDHRIQWIPKHLCQEWSAKLQEFSEYLDYICSKNEITLIAEEFSEEALKKSNAADSMARQISAKSGVQHLFCDPTTQERQVSGISTDSQREQFWLNRLTSTCHDKIIFICGEDHVKSFVGKLRMAGYDPTILSSGWGKGWEVIS
jgi:hypothetical protein